MFKVNNDDMSIYVTRGDALFFGVRGKDKDGKDYTFVNGDLLRIRVFKKKDCADVVIDKEFPVISEGILQQIFLTGEDTKIGGVISKPVDYWYEVELNPYTDPQTIIGYDEDGPKLFRLFPEGADKEGDSGSQTAVPPEQLVELTGYVINPDVIRGYSAYEIAVMHGFNGTEEEWLAVVTAEADRSKTEADRAEAAANRAESCVSYVTPEMFGAVGDGVTDDTQAVKSAIESMGEGDVLLFNAEKGYKLNSFIRIENKKRIKIVRGKFDNTNNTSDVGFIIINSDGVTFEDCMFIKGQQLILLYTCQNIFVNRCTFIETGYAIIQQNGYVSNNVNITNNRAYNLKNDFIECNCEINAPSENWIITDNIYKCDLDNIANRAEECRFFGATECKNIVISNNLIEGARGDSAIHFEDCGDNVIVSNNIIRNCNGYGYICFMSSRRVLIANNIFENETTLNVPFVFATYSDLTTKRNDTEKIIIVGNVFNGNKTQNDPIHCYSLLENVIIEGNTFNDINIMLNTPMITNMSFRNNDVHCSSLIDIKSDSTRANIYMYDSMIVNNKIYGNITISNNYNGVTSKRLMFANNMIYGNVSIKNVENCVFHDNMIGEDNTFEFDDKAYYSKFMYAYNNFIVNVGKLADVVAQV